MMRSRLRATSLAAVLVLAALALPWHGAARAQVSPGPLAAPHAAFDGTTQCVRCHTPGAPKSGIDARCLACHTEMAWMKSHRRGYHATVAAKACASCHPDHGGRDFQLVIWEAGASEKFDHRQAGWVLQGKHATLACRSCHKPELQKSPAAALIRKRNRAASWLGLETPCASCHADPHRGQLGTSCTNCHGQTAWKPAAGFDHARSAFPLTGEHAKVECAKCHATEAVAHDRDAKGQLVPQWKPLPHAACVACHKDPHAGRFPGACAKCHVTTGWHTVGKSGFNHDLTRYPLRGRHVAVTCASCHDPKKAWGEKPKFGRCADCHADAHAGTATLLGQVADCAPCHTVDGYDRPAYTVTRHAQSKYPLLGRHAVTPCAKCHAKLPERPDVVARWGSARVVLRPVFTACAACHTDPHRGRFEPGGARAHPDGCLACHGMAGWRPSKYDGRMHADCVFPLQGAHQAVPCQACHEELKLAPAPESLRADSASVRALHFDNPRRRCVDCHASPHGTQFAERKDKGACEGCHDDRAFVPAPRFVHNRDARYRLEGAHLRTTCAGCHLARRDAAGHTFTLYRPLPTRCESCHAGGVPDSTRLAPVDTSSHSSLVPAPRSPRGPAQAASREAGHATSR